MSVTRLFITTALADQTEIIIEGQQFQHLCKVLRAKIGDNCELFNGDGKNYRAQVVALTKREATLRILDSATSATLSPLSLHIGQVISKGDRMDYAIQKMTELGVSEISPLFSERCDVKLDEDRQKKRREHWQQIAIHACQQCGRASVPIIHSPMQLSGWIMERKEQVRWVLDFQRDEKLQPAENIQSAAVVIGPEGGLSQNEVTTAKAQGFSSLCLGPRVLRTETAPVVAASLLQYLYGDLS